MMPLKLLSKRKVLLLEEIIFLIENRDNSKKNNAKPILAEINSIFKQKNKQKREYYFTQMISNF